MISARFLGLSLLAICYLVTSMRDNEDEHLGFDEEDDASLMPHRNDGNKKETAPRPTGLQKQTGKKNVGGWTIGTLNLLGDGTNPFEFKLPDDDDGHEAQQRLNQALTELTCKDIFDKKSFIQDVPAVKSFVNGELEKMKTWCGGETAPKHVNDFFKQKVGKNDYLQYDNYMKDHSRVNVINRANGELPTKAAAHCVQKQKCNQQWHLMLGGTHEAASKRVLTAWQDVAKDPTSYKEIKSNKAGGNRDPKTALNDFAYNILVTKNEHNLKDYLTVAEHSIFDKNNVQKKAEGFAKQICGCKPKQQQCTCPAGKNILVGLQEYPTEAVKETFAKVWKAHHLKLTPGKKSVALLHSMRFTIKEDEQMQAKLKGELHKFAKVAIAETEKEKKGKDEKAIEKIQKAIDGAESFVDTTSSKTMVAKVFEEGKKDPVVRLIVIHAKEPKNGPFAKAFAEFVKYCLSEDTHDVPTVVVSDTNLEKKPAPQSFYSTLKAGHKEDKCQASDLPEVGYICPLVDTITTGKERTELQAQASKVGKLVKAGKDKIVFDKHWKDPRCTVHPNLEHGVLPKFEWMSDHGLLACDAHF